MVPTVLVEKLLADATAIEAASMPTIAILRLIADSNLAATALNMTL
jgi:hypothetical protein